MDNPSVREVVAEAVERIRLKKPVIAVDFDGTIVEDYYPDIGPLVPGAKMALSMFRDFGCEIVIWSSRNNTMNERDGVNDMFEDMVEFLDRKDIPYDRVDDGKSGKVIADVYIDNRALSFHGDWNEMVLQAVQRLSPVFR